MESNIAKLIGIILNVLGSLIIAIDVISYYIAVGRYQSLMYQISHLPPGYYSIPMIIRPQLNYIWIAVGGSLIVIGLVLIFFYKGSAKEVLPALSH